MRRELLELLADPVGGGPLEIEGDAAGEEVQEGDLVSATGARYPIHHGIPRLVLTRDIGQLETRDAFAFKWSNDDTYGWMRRPLETNRYARWLLEKYGFDSPEEMAAHFEERGPVMDLGCGAGGASYFWLISTGWRGSAAWVGVDISQAIEVARDGLGEVRNTHFVQADALQLPFRAESFGTILSEGVLHHTPSTAEAIASAARILARGGELHFYVYRLKGPIREFTDDYVRDRIASLSEEEAWQAMRPLTRLAQALAELEVEVEVPLDIPLLGIKAGRQDVQRLLYWNFAKMYWNPELSFEENVHINFDWYRPRYAHRQTEEQVRAWCAAADLEVLRVHEQESGYTVRAVRR